MPKVIPFICAASAFLLPDEKFSLDPKVPWKKEDVMQCMPTHVSRFLFCSIQCHWSSTLDPLLSQICFFQWRPHSLTGFTDRNACMSLTAFLWFTVGEFEVKTTSTSTNLKDRFHFIENYANPSQRRWRGSAKVSMRHLWHQKTINVLCD